MAGISEKPVSPDTLLSIKKAARTASRMLGIEPRFSTPSVITTAVDDFVMRWQQGRRPDPGVLPPDDAPMIIGSLWGEAIVSRFKWEWTIVTFPEHILAPAVVAVDRSRVIYPLDHLAICFTQPSADIGIQRAYERLKAGLAQGEAGAYVDLMRDVGDSSVD